MPETAAAGRRGADPGRRVALAPEALRARRRALGLTQAGLATALDVSANTVARWERGELRVGHPERVLRRLALLERRRPGAARSAPVRSVRPEPPPSAGRRAARSGLFEEQPRGLPSALSSFIGRERELRDVRRLLGAARLLTLAGTGGVGKTRLAVALLRSPRRNRLGAGAFVDLAPLGDPELVPQTVAAQLGVREQPGRPVLAALVDVLRRAPLLLVLDNCEHLVEACARLAGALLRACPGLRVLATSREPLGVAGEVVWRVPSLALPEATPPSEQLEDAAAVRLFVARARAARPAFALTEQNARAVADVCRRLDGIPLALELAAAHVPLLSVEQIAERLDDALGLLTRGSRLAPARQQTVRATLDWSYGLLTPPERRLFDRLAVFAGGWTLAAAEGVAGTDGIAPRTVLPMLGRLVDQSLVVVEPEPGGPGRYRLLEALRQYGLERLAAGGGRPRARDRHAAHYLALAEQTAPRLFGPGAPAAQARLEGERDNCRAALRWLVERGATERALRLVGALGRFWFYRGYLAEGEAWTARVLALPGADRPTAGRARALYAAGAAALGRGDYAAVEAAGREALALWRRRGPRGAPCRCSGRSNWPWPAPRRVRWAGPGRGGDAADAARARGRGPRGAGADQPPDRRGAGHRRGDGGAAREQHPGQAGRRHPEPDRRLGGRAGRGQGGSGRLTRQTGNTCRDAGPPTCARAPRGGDWEGASERDRTRSGARGGGMHDGRDGRDGEDAPGAGGTVVPPGGGRAFRFGPNRLTVKVGPEAGGGFGVLEVADPAWWGTGPAPAPAARRGLLRPRGADRVPRRRPAGDGDRRHLRARSSRRRPRVPERRAGRRPPPGHHRPG